MNKITLSDLEKWGCCYSPGDSMWDDVIEPYFRPSRTPLEVANARRFSVRDRIWVLRRADVLGVAGVDSITSGIVDSVVRQHCLHCGIPYVEAWAREWLSGKDRSVESAEYALSAALSARYAALSARSAAYFALSGARYAESARSAAQSAESAESVAQSAAQSAAWSAWPFVTAEEKRQLKIIRRYLRKMEDDE